MKTLTIPHQKEQGQTNLTPFDRLMISEAYQHCYGLRDAIQFDIPDSIQSLAHQTGFRIKFLLDNLEEVKTV